MLEKKSAEEEDEEGPCPGFLLRASRGRQALSPSPACSP